MRKPSSKPIKLYTKKTTVSAWYGTSVSVPNFNSDNYYNFVTNCIGLVSSLYTRKFGDIKIVSVSSRHVATAYADRDNSRIVINQDFLYGNYRTLDVLEGLTATKTIGAVLGVLLHEIGHFAYSPSTLKPQIEYVEMHYGKPVNRNVARIIANVIEDIYIENRIGRDFPTLAWMLDEINRYVIPETRYGEMQKMLSSLTSISSNQHRQDIINYLLFAKVTYVSGAVSPLVSRLYSLARSVVRTDTLDQRCEIVLSLYRALMDEATPAAPLSDNSNNGAASSDDDKSDDGADDDESDDDTASPEAKNTASGESDDDNESDDDTDNENDDSTASRSFENINDDESDDGAVSNDDDEGDQDIYGADADADATEYDPDSSNDDDLLTPTKQNNNSGNGYGAAAADENATEDINADDITASLIADDDESDIFIPSDVRELSTPLVMGKNGYFYREVKIRLDKPYVMDIDPRYKKLVEIAKMRADVSRPLGVARNSGNATRQIERIITDGKIFADRKQSTAFKPIDVMIVIDCSSSMRGYKFDAAVRAAYGCAIALLSAKCTVQVYGHTSNGAYRKDVAYIKFLGRNESVSLLSSRCASVLDNNYYIMSANRDGYALEKFAEMLPKGNRQRVMLVISDGAPSASAPDYSGDEAIDHTRNVVAAIRASGIKVQSLSVDRNAFYTNNRIYGEKNNVNSTDPTALDQIVYQIINSK